MADEKKTVYNHDILGLVRQLDRFTEEMIKSVSSGVHHMNSFDQIRLEQYILAIRTFQGWVLNSPQLDLPETAPRQYELPAAPAVPKIESDAIAQVVTLLQISRDELTSSQSARMPAGLIKFDSDRFSAVVNKVERFLKDYIQKATPLDLPESSPNAAMTGAGSTGV